MRLRPRHAVLLAAMVLIPIASVWLRSIVRSQQKPPVIFSGGRSYPATQLPFTQETAGPSPVGLPLITNVQVIDFDGDGANEVLCCDAAQQSVVLQRRVGPDEWTVQTLIPDVAAPAHATCVDIDADGDLDVIVSVLGNLYPDDSVIGRVELFVNDDGRMVRHVILDDVRRVADVQPGDLDGDGDLDLAVAVFGYARGSVLWLENLGDLTFRDHELLNAPGCIHVPVVDLDGDGDLDIATGVSQDEEELWAFENDGHGNFTNRLLWMTPNFDLGSAGLVQADLDADGDPDLILPAGDNLEDFDAYPQPYHGCLWFENLGDWKFRQHRIADLPGTYAADVADMDGDADLDVVLVSMTNDWNTPGTASVVWLENDGQQQFTSWQVAAEPIHLVTVSLGDVDGDKLPDIIAGGLNVRKPHNRIGRVTAWIQSGSRP